VQDLDSTNGTTINGIPTIPRQRRPVADGDVLGFGAHLRVPVRSEKTLR
jgi:pSer/pThr/pTyr-binding forkhead associated (FHA) protein